MSTSHENLIKGRDNKLDLMRFIGTLLVILAHMGLPGILLDIRTFDVVMLVFISGMSFAYHPPKKFKNYIYKRVKKLLLPTYATILVVFISSYFVCMLLNREQLFSMEIIMKSFLFLDGIGYIWVAKVFLMAAIISPLLYKVASKVKNDWVFLLIIIIVYSIYALFFRSMGSSRVLILDHYVFLLIPYLLVTVVGMRVVESERFLIKLIIVSSCSFILAQLLAIYYGHGFSPNNFKYPPLTYYLLYGMTIGTLMYKLLPNKSFFIIKWGSENSFSIYLMHIICLMGINLITAIPNFTWLNNWLLKYFLVLFCSVVGFIVWKKLLNHFKTSEKKYEYKKNNYV